MFINLSVPVCYKGRHYNGLTVHPGVSYETVDNCSGGNAMQFSGTIENAPTPNVGSISAAIVEDEACPHYLQLVAV